MYRNQYDTDCITWSPQGRIFQIEYAVEGVKHGSCIIGLRSSTHAALCALKRSPSKLAVHNKKLAEIDNHVGVTWSGITADAKVVVDHMRTHCMTHKYTFGAPLPIIRLVEDIGDKSTVQTQRADRRPFCVGTLVAGYDAQGPHVFETCPSGNFTEHYAMALGRRSQASKTYLEKHFKTFPEIENADDLIVHGIRALKASIANEEELTQDNVAVGFVGKDVSWHELSAEQVKNLLESVGTVTTETEAEGGGNAAEGEATTDDTVMPEAS